MAPISFFTDMIQQITERGRFLVQRPKEDSCQAPDLVGSAELVLSSKGEVSGVAWSSQLLQVYARESQEKRHDFLRELGHRFGTDMPSLEAAIEAYQQNPSTRTASDLHKAAEPRRQELLRRLNRAPNGTLALVKMREHLMELADDPIFREVDDDFWHLFRSWFNRGFLMLMRLDWTTPAHVLEKIIKYEAVHEINNFEDLKSRLSPRDRRLYAFFHPALVDEPLIFVEVALTRSMPDSINQILTNDRDEIPPAEASTATFYSISNCQRGLAGVSFGNLLIKQVVEELRRDLPNLTRFVTLSPVPGFLRWLKQASQDPENHFLRSHDSSRIEQILQLNNTSEAQEHDDILLPLILTYLLEVKDGSGKPADPVARFHLGNGARLERVCPAADSSPRALRQAAGFMVNYQYDLDSIESSHEAYAEHGIIALSPELRQLSQQVKSSNAPALVRS